MVVSAQPGTGRADRGTRIVGAVGLDQLQTPFEIAGLDRPDKSVDHRPDRRRFAGGVITPPASAEVTAFIAPAMSAALSIAGKTNLTVRSRQSRMAVGSPTRASSALRVNASASRKQ